jgi:hypothetical protein
VIAWSTCDSVKEEELVKLYQPIIKNVQDSAHMMTESTTQYMSHGASCEGSEERRALKEAKTGKKIVMTELRRSLA